MAEAEPSETGTYIVHIGQPEPEDRYIPTPGNLGSDLNTNTDGHDPDTDSQVPYVNTVGNRELLTTTYNQSSGDGAGS